MMKYEFQKHDDNNNNKIDMNNKREILEMK
jgi:hypothetical protein